MKHNLHTHFPSTIALAISITLLVAVPPALGQPRAAPDIDRTYQARIPLGTEALLLGESSETLYILAMAEAEQFEGWRLVRTKSNSSLTDPAGQDVSFYPNTIRFRITASTRENLVNAPAYPVAAPPDLNQFLLALRFQLKVFRGLRQTVIEPDRVELVGVPEEIPYHERIYQITFRLEDIPITDRCLMEIYSPGGERLARFHMDFM